MRTENNLQIRQNTYNALGIPDTDRRSIHYTERLTKEQDIYSSIKGEVRKDLRVTNNVNCFHPTHRIPLLNPEVRGSW
jgi:hypothetical protein